MGNQPTTYMNIILKKKKQEEARRAEEARTAEEARQNQIHLEALQRIQALNNLKNDKINQLRQLKTNLEALQSIIENPLNQVLMNEYNSQIATINNNINRINNSNNENEVNEIFSSTSQTTSGLSGRIINLIQSVRTNGLQTIAEQERKLNDVYTNVNNISLISANNSIRTSITLFRNNINNYHISQINSLSSSITTSINNLINDIPIYKNSLVKIEEEFNRLNNYNNFITQSINNDLKNANNSIRILITTLRNNINNYQINKIQIDLTSITTAINNLITSIENYKRNLISSAKTSINQSLQNLKGIFNKKTQVNFGTFNNLYNEIDGSITVFIGSLNNQQTDTNNLGIEITRINQRIEVLKNDINLLIDARERANSNIDLKNKSLDNPDFIRNKDLINDNSLNISYDNLKTKINDLRTSLNTFTTNEINSKLVEIDREYQYVYNQIALQSTRIKAIQILNEGKNKLNNLRMNIAEVNEPSLTLKFNIFLGKIDNYIEIINSSTSINDIETKKTEIDDENKKLVDEINRLYEKEMKRREETIQDTLYNDKERGLLNSPIENFRINNRRFEYDVLMINYSGEGNTEIIANDVIFGNHFKRRIGGIEIRYSSRVSVENNPSRLFNGSLAINNNSSFKVQELPKIVMNGEEIRGEFITFRYNKKFVLKKYGFRMSADWKKAIGLWELFYLDENGVYKLLDNNEVRLTNEDYNNTDMEDGNHFIKFLLDNEEKTNEILIIFTGKIESDDKNNGIYLSQVLLYDGKISNIESTCKSIEEIRSDIS